MIRAGRLMKLNTWLDEMTPQEYLIVLIGLSVYFYIIFLTILILLGELGDPVADCTTRAHAAVLVYHDAYPEIDHSHEWWSDVCALINERNG